MKSNVCEVERKILAVPTTPHLSQRDHNLHKILAGSTILNSRQTRTLVDIIDQLMETSSSQIKSVK